MNKERKDFIKNIKFETTEESNKFREQLTNKAMDIMNTYEKYNTPDNHTHLDYTVAAIYLALRSVLPEGVCFRIDFRKKGFRSVQKTTENEIIEKDPNVITKDFLGMKIIITEIEGKLDLDTANPEYKTLIELQNKKTRNSRFIEESREWIDTCSTQTIKTEETYYEKMIELLTRLKDSTYEECILETEVPYGERLEKIRTAYENKKTNDELGFSVSTDQLKDMTSLLKDLEDRLEDKFQRELLKTYIPKALNTDLIKNTMCINSSYEKEKVSEKGYVSDFYRLNVGNKFNLEIQAQSLYRYFSGEKGPSFHSGKLGKKVKIKLLFELVDKKDSMPLSYYLQLLSQMPISVYEKGIIENQNSLLLKQVDDAYSHIKIKDNIILATNSDGPNEFNMDTYLLNFAKYVSANKSTCRSAHSFNTPTVTIENKGLSDSFADVLRKRDGISCLAQLLVDKVDFLAKELGDESNFKSSKELTIRDIMAYAKKINSLEQDNKEPMTLE